MVHSHKGRIAIEDVERVLKEDLNIELNDKQWKKLLRVPDLYEPGILSLFPLQGHADFDKKKFVEFLSKALITTLQLYNSKTATTLCCCYYFVLL